MRARQLTLLGIDPSLEDRLANFPALTTSQLDGLKWLCKQITMARRLEPGRRCNDFMWPCSLWHQGYDTPGCTLVTVRSLLRKRILVQTDDREWRPTVTLTKMGAELCNILGLLDDDAYETWRTT